MRGGVNQTTIATAPDLILTRMRRNLKIRRWVDLCVWSWVGASGLFLIIASLRFSLGMPPASALLVGLLGLTALSLLLITYFLVQVPLNEAAASLDRMVPGAADRFATWVALPMRSASLDWNDALRQEMQGFVSQAVVPMQPAKIPRGMLGVVVAFLAAAGGLQLAFHIELNTTAPERQRVSALLMEAAMDVDASAPELAEVSRDLKNEADRLRENQSHQSQEVAVRALASALVGIRALANAVDDSGARNHPALDGVIGERSSIPSKLGPQGPTPAVAVTADPSIPAPGMESDDELSRRLERLASRLEDKKQAAAGTSDSEDSRVGDSAGSDPNAAKSLLDSLAAGKIPTAAGPQESIAAAPGPGSEQDFGGANVGRYSDPLKDVDGPDLSTQVAEGDDGAGRGFSMVSRESTNASTREQQIGVARSIEFRERSLVIEDIPPGARELVRRYFESLGEDESP